MILRNLAGSIAGIALVVLYSCSKPAEPSGNPPPAPPPPPPLVLKIEMVLPEKTDGQPITIKGQGFHETLSANQVLIAGKPATILSGSVTELVVALPAKLAPGPQTVEVKKNSQSATLEAAFRYSPWMVYDFAGSGEIGSQNGNASEASFLEPIAICSDKDGNLYVSDGNRIRKITGDGQTTTYAGSGSEGFVNGSVTVARFYAPGGLITDSRNNLYVVDQWNHAIRKIDPAGEVSTLAGNGEPGNQDGIGAAARFDHPYGITINETEQAIYVTDYNNHSIRKINLLNHEVTTLAQVRFPAGIILNTTNQLIVTGKNTGLLKRVEADGTVSVMGSIGSTTDLPVSLAIDGAELFILFKTLNQIKKMNSSAELLEFAGLRLTGDEVGPAREAKFFFPEGIVLVKTENNQKVFYITDTNNRKIKKIQLAD